MSMSMSVRFLAVLMCSLLLAVTPSTTPYDTTTMPAAELSAAELSAAETAKAPLADTKTSNSRVTPVVSSEHSEGSDIALSPTTGLPTDKPYRPVLVVLSNSFEARPAWGLADADIVYELIIWGPAHTRYLALYNDAHPELVGGMRSIRRFFLDLRQAWDCPLVTWGGLLDRDRDFLQENPVSEAFLFDGTGSRGTKHGRYFGRSPDRISPHNATADLAQIVDTEWPENDDGTPYEPRLPGLLFSDTPSRGDELAVRVDIPYEENQYYPYYTFNAESRVYERWYDGKEQTDMSGKRIVASNVIVQYAKLSFFQKELSRPEMELVGSGPIDAYIDGTHIRGHWSRASLDDPTAFFDANGAPLTLLPGKTFIQLAPMWMQHSFTGDDGTAHTMMAVPTDVADAAYREAFPSDQ